MFHNIINITFKFISLILIFEKEVIYYLLVFYSNTVIPKMFSVNIITLIKILIIGDLKR